MIIQGQLLRFSIQADETVDQAAERFNQLLRCKIKL